MHYQVVDVDPSLRARAERLLDRYALSLALDPRPTVRFVRSTRSAVGALTVRALPAGTEADGFVRKEEPNVIYINVAAPLAVTIAHEARHVWQEQKINGNVWSAAATPLMEDDAREYERRVTLARALARVSLGTEAGA